MTETTFNLRHYVSLALARAMIEHPQEDHDVLADAAIEAYRAHPDGAAADLGAAAMLRDPAALHINLLRGNYLTREQLLHLGGEAAQIAVAEATARAEKAEAELLATLQREAASIKRWDDKRDELEARLEKAEAERDAAAQWQLIETAPRDGTWLLGAFGASGLCIFRRHDVGGRYEAWVTHEGAACKAPQYWMPLPAGPRRLKQASTL